MSDCLCKMKERLDEHIGALVTEGGRLLSELAGSANLLKKMCD